MQIIKQDFLNNLKIIINKKAKYQKVLLLYDENADSMELSHIFNTLKTDCVFNKMLIDNLNTQELNNGYKLLVFFCSAQSYFNLNIAASEFVNVFIPTDSNVLPFYINENFILQSENNYLFLKHSYVDENIIFSCLLNRAYAAINSLMFNVDKAEQQTPNHLTQQSVLEFLAEFENEKFIDFKMLKELNLDYSYLQVVDYLLLLAFSQITLSAKEKNFALADIYKCLKQDYEKINKFYNLYTNNIFLQVITLNFFYLNDMLQQSLALLNNTFNLKNQFKNINLEKIIDRIKYYCTGDDVVLNYLFLFNVFS